MSDRERRRLLRTEKRIIEEAKEVEIAAIEAKYLNRTEDSNMHSEEETLYGKVPVESGMNYERSPKIRIVFKAKSPENTENTVEKVDEPSRTDVVKDIGVMPSTKNSIPSPHDTFDPTHLPRHTPLIPNENNSEELSAPQLMGDAKLLIEFAEELQIPVAPKNENNERSEHFDTTQDKTTET